MAALIHGGDWAGFETEYGKTPLDFSANISPLGLPDGVRSAAIRALDTADRYPDPLCRELRAALSAFHGIPAEHLVCGNGASDLIDRLCRVLRPRRAAVFTPCFAEYGRALLDSGCELICIALPEADGFRMTEPVLKRVPPDCDLIFVCNPNNPTGLLTEAGVLQQLQAHCRETGSLLVVDECFLDLTAYPERHCLVREVSGIPELVLLRAFTKLYGMAGLRLGYALCGSSELADKLQSCGQPWAVSGVAQAAGVAALRDVAYVAAVRALVTAERPRMQAALEEMDLRVIPGEANFLLFDSGDALLGEKLRERGILLRDCRNFPGLREGWYRTAVRTADENSVLLRTLREVRTLG